MNRNLLKTYASLILLLFAGSFYAQTDGTLTFTYTPTSHTGYSGTKNVLAIWVQTSTGTFVKTRCRYVGVQTGDHLDTWLVNSGGNTLLGASLSGNTVDAVTGATLTNFTTRTVTWDGTDVNAALVADGVYKVTIESTWDHGTSGTTVASYTFTKGPNADHQTPADDANFTNVTLDWYPGSTGVESILEKPALAVYPNPTNGIISVDYKNSNNIKVINSLGAVVFEEKMDQATEGTKNIDLSMFASGIYNVVVANDKGISNYQIVLDK